MRNSIRDAARLTLGRFATYIEPRDAWVGVFVAPSAVYVLLIPFLVFRWDRSPSPSQGGGTDGR